MEPHGRIPRCEPARRHRDRPRARRAALDRALPRAHRRSADRVAGGREARRRQWLQRPDGRSSRRASGARVVSVPRERFSFGRALNLGAANARGELLVALSADAFVHGSAAGSPAWRRLFDDERVACVSGDRMVAGRTAVARGGRTRTLLSRRRIPGWGYSNGAGAFRAALWRRRPFREDLPGCEDQEWALTLARAGATCCVVDPSLVVDHDHTHDSLPAIYRRARREAEGFAMFLDTPVQSPGDLLREWWSRRSLLRLAAARAAQPPSGRAPARRLRGSAASRREAGVSAARRDRRPRCRRARAAWLGALRPMPAARARAASRSGLRGSSRSSAAGRGPSSLFEQLVLPLLLAARRAALVHATNCFLPLVRPCPGVVTIHDLAFETWPEDFAPRHG